MCKTRHNTRRQSIGRILLALYLFILSASFLHNHGIAGHVDYCQDCVSHVRHNAHIASAVPSLHDCVLCNFLSVTYTYAPILAFAVIVPVHRCRSIVTVQHIVRCACCAKMLRAPPSL